MMQFSNPLLLWSLAGLVIPLGIHLLSRKEGKVLRLGSLRHVQETSTQQFKGIRLNEIVLLMLRCAMIILLSLLVSGLQIKQTGNMLWLVVEKGLESHPQVKLILDSLQAEGYEIHFLTNNFPKLDDSSRVASPSNYPKMLNELASKNLNDVIVFAQNRVDGFNGLRRSLPGNIRWIGIPSRSQDFTLAVTSLTQDSLMVRMGHTNANETYFTNDYVSSISSPQIARAKDTIRILLFSEAKYDYDEKIIRASILTIQESFPVVIKYLKANAPGVLADWQLWLSDKPIPTSEAKNILAVIIQPANGLIIRKNYNQWEITQRLNEEVALNENLTVEMAHLLLPTRGLWKTARQMDVRMLPDSTAWPRMEVDEGQLLAGVDKMPADPYILAFMLTLLLIERIIAYQRNQ